VYKFSVDLDTKAKQLNIERASREVQGVHPDIASCYLQVGRVYGDMCLYDQALLYMNRSCDTYSNIHGTTNHIDLASAYGELGRVYYSLGEYSKALEYHTKSLDMRLAVYGSEATHANIATSYNILVLCITSGGGNIARH